MTTTLQQIQDRALAWSVANGAQSLVSNRPVVIARIATIERRYFDLAKSANSYYYATSASANSSNASSDRTLDLSTVAPTTAPVRRLLSVRLPSGAELNQVDIREQDAELSPRYFLRGRTIVEVGSDWGTSGVVALTLEYMRGPAPLDITGALTQTISLEDDFADLLEMGLAWFLAQSDVGRDAGEMTRLQELITQREADYLEHITNFSGEAARKQNIPTKRSQG